MPGKYEKSYQYSAHGISQLSHVWLGWSGIFLCHSYVTLANIFVSFASHITLDNISVSFHWRIFLCHPRLIRRWPASADWHIDKSLGTNTLPTPPLYIHPCPANYLNVRKPACVCMYKVYIQTSQKWKFSVSGAQTGAVSAMLKVTSMLVIARLFTRLRFSTSLLVIARLFISFRFSCQRGPWCQELFKNYISPRAC